MNDTQGINLFSNSASGINLIATDHPENTKISNGKYEIIGEEEADAYQWIQKYIDGGVSGFTDKNIYTLSVDIKVTGAKQDLTLILDFRKDLARQTIGTTTVDHTKNGVWVRYAVSCEFLSICNRALALISAPAGCGIGTTVEYRNFKLEPGIVTNPIWSPAPEDLVVRSELDALKTTVPIRKDQGETFSGVLKGRTNQVTFLRFSDPTDNPFSFDHGFAIAFHASMLYTDNQFKLIGTPNEGDSIEAKFFELSS